MFEGCALMEIVMFFLHYIRRIWCRISSKCCCDSECETPTNNEDGEEDRGQKAE